MTGFVQIVEFTTSRIDDIRALADERRPEMGTPGGVRRFMATADRDPPGYYFSILEFDSYESAMETSNRPETGEFAARLAELCDGPPKFYNLDVMQTGP